VTRTNNEYLKSKIYLELSFTIPQYSNEYQEWAEIFLSRENLPTNIGPKTDDASSVFNYTYIKSIIHFSRLLCELVGLPTFDAPKLISLSQDKLNPAKCRIKIESSLDNLISKSVYKSLIRSALKICEWMAQHSATPDNKRKLFKAITEEVIEPLHQIIPAGKSTIPVLRAAHSLGIPFIHLGLGVYQLGWGSKARRLDRSVCEFDSAIGSKLAQNKVATANILREVGLPAPVHGVITTETDALSLATKIGFPVVVKPSDRDRGEGVTVDIFRETQLKAAFAHAQKLSKSKQVIVERQVLGTCHRLFIVNGKLLYAVKRHPISVIGDGQRTVSQLVDDEVLKESFKPPWERSEIKPIDELALQTLQKLGLSLESVPGKDIFIPLRPIETTEWGGVDEDVTQAVHSENLRIALQAAKIFGLHIAGIDIISPDIAKPWHANGAIINEVNFAPLFGGAEISRSYIPKFFEDFMDGNGKISIEVFDNEKTAEAFQKRQAVHGMRCYLTTANRTIDELGEEIVMPFKNIKQRIRALILRSDVDAIAIVNQEKIP
jgi:cyanophycin synthetase